MNPLDPKDPLQARVKDLEENEARLLPAPLALILESQRQRIEYAETRRAALGVLGGVILGAGLAALIQLAKGGVPYRPAGVGLIAVACGLSLTGIAVLAIYGRQTNWDYPFKAVSKTWKWFYRDAVPRANDLEPPWHTLQSTKFRSASRKAFNVGRGELAEKLVTLTDPEVDLTQDLEQIHLLHWNEFYKNQFLSQLRSVLIRGVMLSALAGIAGFLLALILN